METMISIFVVTGGIFWILAFAYFVGWAGEKLGIEKKIYK